MTGGAVAKQPSSKEGRRHSKRVGERGEGRAPATPKSLPTISLSPLTPSSILRTSSTYRGGPGGTPVSARRRRRTTEVEPTAATPSVAEKNVRFQSRQERQNNRRYTSPARARVVDVSTISAASPPALLLSRPMESLLDEERQRGTPDHSISSQQQQLALSDIFSPEYTVMGVTSQQRPMPRGDLVAEGGVSPVTQHLTMSDIDASSPVPHPLPEKKFTVRRREGARTASGTSIVGSQQGLSRSPTAPTYAASPSVPAPSVSRRLHDEGMTPVATNRVSLATINPIQSHFPVIPHDPFTPEAPKRRQRQPAALDVNPLTSVDFARGGLLTATGYHHTNTNTAANITDPMQMQQEIIRHLLQSLNAMAHQNDGRGLDSSSPPLFQQNHNQPPTAAEGEPSSRAPSSSSTARRTQGSRKRSVSAATATPQLPPPGVTFLQGQEALRKLEVEATGLSRRSLQTKRAIQDLFLTQYATATAGGSEATRRGSVSSSRARRADSGATTNMMDDTQSCASFVTVRSSAIPKGNPSRQLRRHKTISSPSVCVSESDSTVFLTTSCSADKKLRNLRRRVTLTGGGMVFGGGKRK